MAKQQVDFNDLPQWARGIILIFISFVFFFSSYMARANPFDFILLLLGIGFFMGGIAEIVYKKT